MPRFEKTRIHWIAAVLFLLGIYGLAGLGYAAYADNPQSMTFWGVLAVVAIVAGLVFQRVVVGRRS